MTRSGRRARLAGVLAILAASAVATAADEVVGSFTVNGRTTALRRVYVSIEQDPADPATEWLVLLLANRVVEAPDRTPARLLSMSRAGDLQAVRVLWAIGSDRVRAVPYHREIADSGLVAAEPPTLDLQRFDEDRVEALIQSKRLGQAWHYGARVKATPVKGAIAELEPEREATDVEVPARPPAGVEPRALKAALGGLGYEANDESFARAVKDGSAEAVTLFLRVGLSPNVEDEGNQPLMITAASFCAFPPHEPREPILLALIGAGGDVNARDQNGATPLIWAVQSCSPAVVRALLDAGADVGAKARGGATALMMAEVFKRSEIVEMLKAAGAR